MPRKKGDEPRRPDRGGHLPGDQVMVRFYANPPIGWMRTEDGSQYHFTFWGQDSETMHA